MTRAPRDEDRQGAAASGPEQFIGLIGPPGLRALGATQQLPGLHTEGDAQAFDIVDGNVALRPLHRADIGPMETNLGGEVFLAPTTFISQFPEIGRENFAKRGVARGHVHDIRL